MSTADDAKDEILLARAERVRRLRRMHPDALSQEDLAARAHVSKATIQNLETAKRATRRKELVRIAEALRVTPHEIAPDVFPPVSGHAAAG